MSNTSSSYYESNLGSQYGLPNPAISDWLKLKGFKYNPLQNTLYPTTSDGQTVVPAGTPVPPEIKSKEAFDFETWQKMQQVAAKTSAESTRQQLADLFPYYTAGASQATARNLAASTQYFNTKQASPDAQALRNQIAQGQIASSQSGEAIRDQGTAAQTIAAKNFAKGYAGSMVNTTA